MTGLFLGRFNPFHKGHLTTIYKIFDYVDELKIAIGSSQEHHTKRNPFTFGERIAMIERSLDNVMLIQYGKFYNIIGLPDIFDPPNWPKYVMNSVGNFDILFSSNINGVVKLFENDSSIRIKIQVIEREDNSISGTKVREKIANDGDWQSDLPKGTIEVLQECDSLNRIKDLFRT